MVASRLCLLLTMLAMAACTTPTGPREAERVERIFQADALYNQGQFREAAEAYAELARRDRQNRSFYRLRSAESWREEGEWGRVEESLRGVERGGLEREDLVRLDLLSAEVALARGDARSALALLLLPEGEPPTALRLRWLELKARALAADGDRIGAARERARLDALLPEAEKAGNAEELRVLLEALPAEVRLGLLRSLKRDDPLFTWLMRATRTRTGPEDYASQLGADSGFRSDARRSQRLAGLPRAELSRIALLLPAGGPYAAAARAIRDGVFAAYFADRGPRPELLLIDSGTSAEQVIAAYRQAVRDGAERVIGPFPREHVTALFQSGVVSVPTLSLNFAEAPFLPPPGSLQFALLPEEEAAAVAERFAERGVLRVVALVPSDEFGERTLAAFRQRFEALGGRLVGATRYDPNARDPSNAVREVIGLGASLERIRLLRTITGLELDAQPIRRIDADGLFLAARPQPARVIVPQLRLYDALDWPVLATSHIYAGVDDPAQDRDLDGVAFAELRWMLGETEVDAPARAAVSALDSARGSAGRLFAFGIDAYRLLPYLEWLERHPGEPVDGAIGPITADANGSLRRRVDWARFVDGRARPEL